MVVYGSAVAQIYTKLTHRHLKYTQQPTVMASGRRAKALTKTSDSPRLLVDSPLTTKTKQTINKLVGDDSTDPLLWKTMDEHLAKHCESIVTLLSSKMSSLEASILQKFESQVTALKSDVSHINERVLTLEQSFSATAKRNDSLQSEVLLIKKSVCEVQKQLSEVSCQQQKQITNLETELFSAKQAIEAAANKTVATDAVLYGVPFNPDENLKTIYHRLCHTLNIMPPTLKAIIRTRPTKSSNNSVILIKFNLPHDRNFLLKSLALYRKQCTKSLCLRDLDFPSDSPIFLRESLSKRRLEILHAALNQKKHKQLSAVFTVRGCVYVKRSVDCQAVHVDSIEDLDSVAGVAATEVNVSNLT